MGSEESSTVSVTMSPRLKRIINEDNIPCQIDTGLYLGSLGAGHMRMTLKALNVTRVLTLNSFPAELYPDDFVYKTILLHDRVDVDILRYLGECFAFIDEARASGGGVLVHCTAGISRSVTIILGYLMFKNGMSLPDAMQHVVSKRPVAHPNVGFRKQLVEYERYLQSGSLKQALDKLSTAVKERDEVIEEMEKLKQRNRREKKEAFKLGFKAGAQSLLCSFEDKKCVSEPLVGRVRSFLESPTFEASLDSFGDEDPYRLEVDYFDGMILEESSPTKGGDLDVVQAHHLDGHEAATAMPVGEDTPRDE